VVDGEDGFVFRCVGIVSGGLRPGGAGPIRVAVDVRVEVMPSEGEVYPVEEERAKGRVAFS
jgi:hypothetical protein